MDQAFESFFQTDKRAKVDDVGDHPLNHLPNGVPLLNIGPRIGPSPFETERYPSLIHIHREHRDLDFLVATEDIPWVSHSAPRDLRNVDQPLESAQVHEHPKIADVGDPPGDSVARTKVLEHLMAGTCPRLGRPF